jgi:hypothetical protein
MIKKLAGLVILLIPMQVFAVNPLKDFLDNTTFPIGESASAGTAINLRNGKTSTSFLAEIMDYRMFAFSYGGTRVNESDANFTDTAKVGLKLAWVFSQFTNSLPPSASFLKNINVGPSIAMSLLSTPRQVTPFFDINYTFGGGDKVQATVTAPSPVSPEPNSGSSPNPALR